MPRMTLDPRLNAWRPDLADARLEGRVEAAAFVTGEIHRIRRGVVALREAPDERARCASEVFFGERIRLFAQADGWAWLQAESDDYVGYAPADALVDGTACAPAPTHRVTALASFLYPAPDVKSPPLDRLPLTADVALTGARETGFAELATGGWIYERHIAPRDTLGGDFVAAAEGFAGTPYLWGGKSHYGIDCSGLVQVALRATGRQVLRDTDMQAENLGVAVETANVRRRGDIVFFPGHVGIMTDETTLLHANAWTMTVASEPLNTVIDRLSRTCEQPLRAVRRIA